MPVLDDARSMLEKRLSEIEDEKAKIENAIKHLGGEVKRGPGRPRGSRNGSAPKRRRRRRNAAPGQRRDQFMASLKANPNCKLTEIAKDIGVSGNQASGLARQLVDAGHIEKTGRGTYAIR